MTGLIPALLLFLGCLALALGAGGLIFAGELRRGQATRRRLLELGSAEAAAQAAVKRLWRDSSLSSIPLLDRALARLPRIGDLRLLIQQAGNPTNPGALALTAGTLACLGLLGASLTSHRFLLAVLPLAGGLAPLGWLCFLRKRRLAVFDEQFPEALDLMARALRAGHGLGSALQMVAQEMENPVAEEFGRSFADYSYGKTLDEALVGMVQRVGSRDVKFFATAVVMQRETGGNLTEILDNIGHIVRQRFRLLRQVRALSAEGRLSGTILSLLAPILLLVLWFTSPGYLDIMFGHPLGELLLGLGLGFQVMGVLVVRWLVRLKV